MKTLKLKVKDMFGITSLLNSVYGAGGLDLVSFRTAIKIIEKIIISEEYGKKIEMKEINGRISWNDKKDNGIDVEFSEDEIKMIKEVISSKSDSKKLSISESFVIGLMEQLEKK